MDRPLAEHLYINLSHGSGCFTRIVGEVIPL